MNDYDQREEIYRRQEREEELTRVSKAITDYNPQDVIGMSVTLSCTEAEAIQKLHSFCHEQKHLWGEDEDSFRRMFWAVDKTNNFLNKACAAFVADKPKITSVEYW